MNKPLHKSKKAIEKAIEEMKKIRKPEQYGEAFTAALLMAFTDKFYGIEQEREVALFVANAIKGVYE